ncbi:MAG: hypothetical protein ABIZ36_06735, partial [Gemmatimonadaceae bacterium]
MIRCLRGPVFLALLACLAIPVAARSQDRSPDAGTIAGVAVDSVRGGYLKDAIVSVEGTSLTATTDSVGRFRIDNVPEGSRRLRIAHPLLDTLGIAVATPRQEVRRGEALSFIVAIPSPAPIVKNRCSQDQRAKGPGALVGVVVDADTEMPSRGANVIVTWIDVVLGD